MAHNQSLRTRTILLFCGILLCYTALCINLLYIQILHHDFFSHLGAQQYRISVKQYPARADIIDRHGQTIACNKQCFSAFIIPNQIQKPDALRSFLARHFPLAVARYEAQLGSRFMFVKRKLTPEECTGLKQAQSPDIHLLSETSRFYAIPTSSALIGFTDIENCGKAGIEYFFNRELAGSPTLVSLEKDARSGYFYFDKQLHAHGFASKAVQLTIDADLQFLVDEILLETCDQKKAKKAMAIIIDPHQGDILAISSVPSCLPSDQSFDLELTKHAAIAEQHEFGSVMKVFTALAALEEQVVTPDEYIDCKNSTESTIYGRKITTWKAHGTIPFTDVIAFSNNIGIAKIAHRIGSRLYDHYIRLGFGKKIGICLPAESSGSLPAPHAWSAQSLFSLSYGYEIAATLLQLAQAFCVIAHDGHFVKPRLTLSEAPKISADPLYRPETIETIQNILRQTTEHGTGWRARLKGFDVMTKTGSAYMLNNGAYDPDKNIFTAAAVCKKGNYQRIVIVSIIEPESRNAFASTIAMPALRTIMQKMVIHERAL